MHPWGLLEDYNVIFFLFVFWKIFFLATFFEKDNVTSSLATFYIYVNTFKDISDDGCVSEHDSQHSNIL